MRRFAVDLTELDAVVSALDAFGERFAARLADLQQTVDELQQDWLGEAADAQAVAHRRIAAGSLELQAALSGLHRAAHHAHASYTAAVTANVATWRQVEPR